MSKLRNTLLIVSMLLAATNAFAFEKGQTLLGLHVGGGESAWLAPASAGYVTTAPSLPTLRAGAELWYFTKNDQALTFSGGIDHFSETDKPGTGAPTDAVDQKSTISGYHLRVGMDHMWKVADQGTFYMGGGLVYGSSKFKYEAGTVSDESAELKTYGLDGRVGGLYSVNKSVAMGGRIGHSFGMSSGEKDGAKASATASGFYGEAMIVFSFGGK